MAATMRYHNRYNMEAIGITEQEVMDYTDAREQEALNTNKAPDFSEFYSEPINPDKLSTLKEFDEELEKLKVESETISTSN